MKDYCDNQKIDRLLGTAAISRSMRDVERASVLYSS